MKISAVQLEMAVAKMKYSLLGWTKDDHDIVIEVSLTKEDPGNGIMVDCLTLKASIPRKNSKDLEEGQVSMSIELYPEQDKITPRASKTESYPVTSKY